MCGCAHIKCITCTLYYSCFVSIFDKYMVMTTACTLMCSSCMHIVNMQLGTAMSTAAGTYSVQCISIPSSETVYQALL